MLCYVYLELINCLILAGLAKQIACNILSLIKKASKDLDNLLMRQSRCNH